MELCIDTIADRSTVQLGARRISFPSRRFDGKQTLVQKIENLLQRNNLEPADISAVAVNPGPGPYTAVRVGVSVANALARVWNKPIRYSGGRDIVSLARPVYQKILASEPARR